jgi:uncharacterized protein (TIGR00156 family)
MILSAVVLSALILASTGLHAQRGIPPRRDMRPVPSWLSDYMREQAGLPPLAAGPSAAAMSPVGFKGPGLAPSTVAQALKANDDTDVLLNGQIVRPAGGSKFIFKDDTGEVTIDVDSRLLPKDQLQPASRVVILGDLDKGGRPCGLDLNPCAEVNVTWISRIK